MLIPTTRARPSPRAPPELPGLSAASVWITFSISLVAERERVGSERPSAETTPAVTEPLKPLGLPIATTSWPTLSSRRRRGWPGQVAALGPQHGQVGERVGADHLQREVASVGEGGGPAPSVPATTWAALSMNPSELIATPLPAPILRRPRGVLRLTVRWATEGPSRSATPETVLE